MNDALVSFLAGQGPLPERFAGLTTSPELELLQRLCGRSRARASIAAQALEEALGAASAPTPAHALAPTPAPALAPPPAPAPASAPTPTPAPASAPAPAPAAASVSSFDDAFASAHDAVLRVLALEEDVARLSPWLGVGWHREGTPLVDVVHDRLADLEGLLARAPALTAIADLVGRLEAGARPGHGAERGGRSSVVGVTTGGELADALPMELALLASPDTEDLFLMRLAERRLLSLELIGEEAGDPREAVRRGPALVCVDTSGSMIGVAEELGKAAALMLLRRILGEGRRAEVALFGGEGSMKTVPFRPRQASARALFDLLMTSFHGGTDFDQAIAWALERRHEPGLASADLVLVSDGRGRLRPDTVKRVEAARRAPTHPLRVVFVEIRPGPDGELPTSRPTRLEPFRALADETVTVTPRGASVTVARAGVVRSGAGAATPPKLPAHKR